MQIIATSTAPVFAPVGQAGQQNHPTVPRSETAREDSVRISQEGREKAAAMKSGKGSDGDSPGGSAPVAVAVNKDSVVSDLQDTETKISSTKRDIEKLERQAETDDSKKQELIQKKVKLDDLEDDASRAESKLLS